MTRPRSILTTAVALSLAPAAWAVQPASWVHTSEADFSAGETDHAVVTNLGDIKVAAATTTLAEAPEDVTIFSEIQPLNGALYIAAGPRGRLLRRQGDTTEQVAALEDAQVFALAVYDGKLLVAISGEPSRLAVLEGDTLRTMVELPSVRYLWDVLVDDGAVIVATGVDGKVLRIDPDDLEPVEPSSAQKPEQPPAEPASAGAPPADADGEDDDDEAESESPAPEASPVPSPEAGAPIAGVTELLDTVQANVLCLGLDARGRIYAGTDTDGLVYRLTPAQGGGYDVFVIYDAAEPEIGALLVEEDGTVFAGTADAEQARPGRLEEAQAEPAGRPEVGGEAPPAEGEGGEGEMPEPGDLPQVPPGPEPIGDPEAAAPAEAASAAVPEALESAPAQAETGPDAASTPAEAGSAGAEAPEPTAEQYDRLREVIRARLDAARRSGTLQAGARPPGRRPPISPAGAPRVRPPATPTPAKEGNAVYRIDPQGFVTEVFRESAMILRLVRADGRLLVATGNEGQVFSVDPRAEETTTLIDLEAEQVPALLIGPGGDILLGSANPARLLRLSDQLAEHGAYTSPVMDASQISLWGGLDLTARVPDGASVLIQTRSGNVQDPEQAPWSPWTDGQTLGAAPAIPHLQPRQIKVQAPPARFLQYRLTLTPADGFSPVVERVEVTYVTPNMRPSIASVRATYPEPTPPGEPGDVSAPSATLTVEWEASDANEDQLVYKLEYQPGGADRWLLIEDDLTETRYEWHTRRVPDGRYVIRVTANDRRDNPGSMAKHATRRSDPVLVDNGRPGFEELAFEQDGGRVTIRGIAADALSEVRSLGYVVDSGEHYLPVLPDDLIFDSTSEPFEIMISDLSPGAHVATLRVTDDRGNTAYRSVMLEIQP